MKPIRIIAALLALLLLLPGCARQKSSAVIPILLYHHLNEEGDDGSAISVDGFRQQMELLKTEGYHPISFEALMDFAENGAALPKKPVIITFDDGYYSNYQYAFPILKEYGFPATIFAIGCSIGHMQYYKDTSFAMTPHFGKAEIGEMLESGLISIQSHTYDMHQWPPFESGDRIRENVLPLEGESEADYIAALTADHRKEQAALKECGVDAVTVIAYPHGKSNALANQTLQQAGVRVTLTTNEEKINTVTAGQPESLIDLGRLSINETTSRAKILEYLERIS